MPNINLYLGKSGTGKTYACYEKIKKIIETCPGEPIILLVPDPATYKTERDLAEFMPQKGFTTVRVVGFGRLAYQIFQSTGKIHPKGLSDIGQKLLLRLVMKRDADQLDILSPVAKQPHFADVMQNLMAECEAFQVSSATLAAGAASDRVSSQTLKRKLSALAKIMGSYEDMVHDLFGDYTSRFEELIRVLPTSPLLHNAHVFIDGFHWFTPLQFALIQTLLTTAKESILTITIPTLPEEFAATSRKGSLFGRSREVYDDIQKVFVQQGIPVQEHFFEENKRFHSDTLQSLAEGFFATPARANSLVSDAKKRIPLLQGYNRDREADAVCRKILALMEENPQRRWKDFTIMLRESETYGDVLEKNLARYEIPFFSDRRNPMITHPLAEFLRGLLEMVSRRFQHDALFRLLKTDFFPLERSAVDELENYCLEFGIHDFMWLRDEWTYKRQEWEKPISELEDEATESPLTVEEARLQRVNESHKVIMSFLKPWWDFARKEHTGAEWCDKLYEMIEKIGIPQKLSEWSTISETLGEMTEAASHEQMYKKVISFFDEVYKVAQEEVLSLDEMGVLLEEGLGDVTYSLVPPSLDHVTITTIERGYTRESPIVFVMGLNEGVFPQRMGDEGILKDQERQELQAAGITLAAGALARSFNEQFLFYLACTRAQDQLYLSYAQADTEGAKQEPSLLIKRLIQLGYCDDFGIENGQSMVAPLTIPDGKEDNYIWRLHQSLSLLASRFGALTKGQSSADDNALWWRFYDWLRVSGRGDALARLVRGVLVQNEVELIDKEVVAGLFLRNNEITGSVTRIERYQACPFSFYSQYGLKLEPRRVKSLGAPEIGTFLHENLRVIGEKLLKENKRWSDLDETARKEICEAASNDLAKELLGLKDYLNADGELLDTEEDGKGTGDEVVLIDTMKARLEATLERTVRRLGIWSENSKFNTKYLEQGFGHGPNSPWQPIYIGLDEGKAVRLQGQIDRIDEYTVDNQTYGLIIDYKSGNSYISAADIYHGLKLQLITYLLALEKNEQQVIPAGLVYTAVKNPRTPINSILIKSQLANMVDEEGQLKNSGYFLDNAELLLNMDQRLSMHKSTEFVPLRITSKNVIHGQDKNKAKTLEDFITLTNYSEKIIRQAGNDILAGKFPISPYNKNGHRPCTWCQYKNICRFEKVDGSNNYRYLDSLSENEGLDKMRGGEVYGMDKGTRSSH